MKLHYLAIFGATAFLTVGCVAGVPGNQSTVQAKPSTSTSTTTKIDVSSVAADQPTATLAKATSRSGNFVTAAHSTQGMVSLVTDNGQRYLKFDETFKTDNGPDLMVLLHRQTVPKSYSKENYQSLGRLEQVSGTQRYRIPADVNPEDFSSVVIWCRKFNVTFGYATLSN